jgi:hypothetical protein
MILFDWKARRNDLLEMHSARGTLDVQESVLSLMVEMLSSGG